MIVVTFRITAFIFFAALITACATTQSDLDYNSKPVVVLESPVGGTTIKIGKVAVIEGGKSYDPSGEDIQFSWTVESVPGLDSLILNDPFSDRLSFTPKVSGQHDFKLVVTNESGISSDKTVRAWVPPNSDVNGSWWTSLYRTSTQVSNSKHEPVPNFCENMGGGGGGGHPLMLITYTYVAVVSTITLCLPTATTNEINKTEDTSYNHLQRYRFVAWNQYQLARDLSAGGGEYADALAFLFGCPPESRTQYVNLVREDFDQIFITEEIDPGIILERLEARIAQHPELSVECTSVS